ncbi:hypothetical protein ABEB36_004983 [Hypothenemus hampei]|uniref:Uncharacterized protein n=1 Tax=Hypothenemus hampei TaxID=57062 RepID=A0ABD1EX46_HYPHA
MGDHVYEETTKRAYTISGGKLYFLAFRFLKNTLSNSSPVQWCRSPQIQGLKLE